MCPDRRTPCTHESRSGSTRRASRCTGLGRHNHTTRMNRDIRRNCCNRCSRCSRCSRYHSNLKAKFWIWFSNERSQACRSSRLNIDDTIIRTNRMPIRVEMTTIVTVTLITHHKSHHMSIRTHLPTSSHRVAPTPSEKNLRPHPTALNRVAMSLLGIKCLRDD